MNVELKRALISVTDKLGLERFAKSLVEMGVEIVASGGTAAVMRKAGVKVTEVADITGFPEIMDGRVKTLHPKIHGGILADREKALHLEQASELSIELIDLVVVNLYKFEEAAMESALGEREVVEEIDIGGPALIRAAAKNYHSVTVIVDPSDYDRLIEELSKNGGSVSLETRRSLASKAFLHTTAYDAAIFRYFEGLTSGGEKFNEKRVTVYEKIRYLRYGENPHLQGALYRDVSPKCVFGDFKQLHGKELSYNNIQDMYAAFLLTRDLGIGSCAVIKHMNPCGAALCENLLESFTRAKKTDPISAFGSVVSINGTVDASVAEACREIFHEVIIARGFTPDALGLLKKKKNLRLVVISDEDWDGDSSGLVSREAGDLLLVQERDEGFPELEGYKIVTSRKPSESEIGAMKLAWKIVKHIRSNAIVIGDKKGTIGVGAGQMSRVDSCWIAVEKARREGLLVEGASAASDAFFPFPDGVEVLAGAGVKSIIQPGGSIRDNEVIKAADGLGIAMILTGRRHFRH